MAAGSVMSATDLHSLRMERGENQRDFWKRLGVAQVMGSRYERGQVEMPETVGLLARYVYGKKKARTTEQVEA